MSKELYIKKSFSLQSQDLISKTNDIISKYQQKGYSLTLRQLYYQMIAKDLFPSSWIDEVYNAKNKLPKNTKNTVKSYNKFGNLIGDARLGGLIDWKSIEDRTRNLKSLSHWNSPSDIINDSIGQYKIDKWDVRFQKYRIEVWIEKDALAGVISKVCKENDISYFACRGYNSITEMWVASKRFRKYVEKGQTPVILHLGDHDPSGIDMTRDIKDRLKMFLGAKIPIARLALNMNQIEELKPPPNPAKVNDPRAKGYIERFGNESWELDALEPEVLNQLVQHSINRLIDGEQWDNAVKIENSHISKLEKIRDGLKT